MVRSESCPTLRLQSCGLFVRRNQLEEKSNRLSKAVAAVVIKTRCVKAERPLYYYKLENMFYLRKQSSFLHV